MKRVRRADDAASLEPMVGIAQHAEITQSPDSSAEGWSVDKSEVSWRIDTKPARGSAQGADSTAEDVGIVSHMLVGIALSVFVYNVLHFVDHPVVRPHYWQRSSMETMQRQAWEYMFPPDPALFLWIVPDNLQPVGVQAKESAAATSTPFAQSTTIRQVREGKFSEDWVDDAMDAAKPVVVRGAVRHWKAVRGWNPAFVAEQLKTITPHISADKSVRMHSIVHPLGQLPNVSWSRPWVEEEMSAEEFFKPTEKNAYLMLDHGKLPSAMRSMLGSTQALSVLWRKVDQVNAWFGGPGISTPLHYDAMHNSYAQIRGRKRFILFPAAQHGNLYLFPRIHPSSRMSQVDLQKQGVSSAVFERFAKAAPHALTVELSPGDVLYIPPYWFHYVEVTSEETAMSISVHTESEAARIRDRMLVHQLPIAEEWSPPKKAAALEAYIYSLFKSAKVNRLAFMTTLVESRFDTLLAHDAPRQSPGLREGIATARARFTGRFSERRGRHARGRSPLPATTIHLIDEHATLFNRLIHRIHGRKGISKEEREIELANYIEDVTAAVVGAEYTDAFFRCLLEVERS